MADVFLSNFTFTVAVALSTPGGLCSRAPFQICRLTDTYGVHPSCVAKPLITTPILLQRPAVLAICFLGLVLCFDRGRGVFSSLNTAARAVTEYAVFFFCLASWNVFSILDHSFFPKNTGAGKALVFADVLFGLAAAVALALASVAEMGTTKQSKYFSTKCRAAVLAGSEAALLLLLLVCYFSNGKLMQAFYLIVIIGCTGVYIVMSLVQAITKHMVRHLFVLAAVGAIELAGVVCFFVFGVDLCQRISPHFAGEEIFLITTNISVWVFYLVYASIKYVERKEATEVVQGPKGEMIVLHEVMHQNVV